MNQLIISVHGIRTFGGWQDRLERLLMQGRPSDPPTVVSYRYGYFSVIAFLVPFLRWLVVRRFRNFLTAQTQEKNWDRIDLVGHSFGTHIIAWGLYGVAESKRPKIHSILLAGSVLKSNFPWQQLIGRCVGRLINDCGTKDAILLLSQFLVLFTGMAGRLGFNGGTGRSFRNRYFKYGHSGYFLDGSGPYDGFMQRHWVPLLVGETDPELVDERDPGALGGFTATLLNNAEPIKLIVYLTPIIVFAAWITGLYVEADTQRRIAEKRLEIATQSANKLVEQIVYQYREYAGVPSDLIIGILERANDLMKEFSSTGEARSGTVKAQGVALLELSSAYRGQGKTILAVRDARDAIELLHTVPAMSAVKGEGQIELAAAYDRLGDALNENCDQSGAQSAYKQGSKILDELPYSKDSDARVGQIRAVAYEKTGSIAFENADFAEALKQYGKSLQLRQKIAVKYPGDIRTQLELSAILDTMATTQMEMNDLAEAEKLETESRGILNKLDSGAFKRADIIRARALDRKRHGITSNDQDRLDPAIVRVSLTNLEQLVELDPARPELQWDLMHSTFGAADDLWNSGNRGEAKKLYREAEQIAARLSMNTSICPPQKQALAVIHQKFGEVAEEEDANLALAAYRRSLEIRKTFADGMSANWEVYLAQNYLRICELLLKLNKPQDALVAAQDQLALGRHLAERGRSRGFEVKGLATVSWYALFAREFQVSVAAAEDAQRLVAQDAALRREGDWSWIQANSAHALMLSGRVSEARAGYAGYKESAPATWENSLKCDFKDLNGAGLHNPLMDEVTLWFSDSAPCKPLGVE